MDGGMHGSMGSGEISPGRHMDRNNKEADLGAEMFAIASDFGECLSTGLQQEMVQDFLVLQGERRQFMR